MEKVSVVIAAGGKGTRMGAGENKVFMKLRGKEILLHTVEAFHKNPDIDEIVVVAGEGEYMRVTEMIMQAELFSKENSQGVEPCAPSADLIRNTHKLRAVTTGGATRRESVYNGIRFTTGDIILIHDAARCLISQEEISASVNAAREYGAAAVGVPCKDTLKSADADGFITGTVDREKTFLIQTPQAFKRDIIRSAHDWATENNIDATDDCALVEMRGGRIKIIKGRYDNIKITTPDDIEIAEKILEKRADK